MHARNPGLLLVLVASVATLFAPAIGGADPAKGRDIEELLRVLGYWDEGARMQTELIQSVRLAYPNVPAAEWDALEEYTTAAHLNAKYLALYDRLYSAEEIREILAFHRTPAGRKWRERSQQLEDNLRIARRDFESRLGERVARLLHEHGYPQAGNPAARRSITPVREGTVSDRPRVVQPIE